MRFWTSKTRGIGIAGENSILFAITLMTSHGLGTCGIVETALKSTLGPDGGELGADFCRLGEN